MHRTVISALVAMLWMTGLWACGPSFSPPPCYDPTSRLGEGMTSRQGMPCTQQCECNNQRYEGYCNTQGLCELSFRESCSQKGTTRICTLHTSRMQGACTQGIQTCWPEGLTDAKWGNCEPVPREPENTKERCLDHKDNDCDGKIDREQESCKQFCLPGERRTCFTIAAMYRYQGRCIGGFQVCDETTHTWKSECIEEPQPTTETCNGLDDNCNGFIDEDLPNCACPQEGRKESCYSGPTGSKHRGICTAGVRECVLTVHGVLQWSPCRGEIRPQPEVCNGKDDNCNGLIDEGCPCDTLGPRSCGLQQGMCRSGQQHCQQGRWSHQCHQAVEPTSETCDGQDNDCDGFIDANLQRRCTTACGEGVEQCVEGQWQPCSAPQPQPEICNNQDDDCNGKIDDLPPRTCATSCGQSVQTCENGRWTACSEPQLQPETCNNKDDDCDGQIDENLHRPCSTSCGEGQEYCKAGQWVGCTAPQPQPETCNNQDDDCNGKIDDVPPRSCTTPCGSGTEICQQGQWVQCTAPQPQPEICNNQDDDCNGKIDDGVAPRTCSTPCGTGLSRCEKGQWHSCQPHQAPAEICNNQDDNCNGLVDEGLQRTCLTACGQGIETCRAGVWQGCTAPQPQPEICNNQDDDCDGLIDNGVSRVCQDTCGDGLEHCVAGQWGPCLTPIPQPETCNNRDDDCNGKIDDLPHRVCTSACGQGMETCEQGQWVRCTAPQPQPEVCNNQDDDCNGKIDDLPPRSCQNTCGTGKEICIQGQWSLCDAPSPQAEVCNGKDDDCDGQIDNQLTDLGQPCLAAGLHGRCSRGIISACTSGQPVCQPGTAQPEVCNGEDDDCNGLIDDQVSHCVITLAGTGQGGFKDGAALQAEFGYPRGMAFELDTAGQPKSLLIVDTLYSRIRRLDLKTNIVSTLTGSSHNFQDGTLAQALFQFPEDIAGPDVNGYYYIADRFNNRIRKLDIAGDKVSTEAGDGRFTWLDGSSYYARFAGPVSVTMMGNNAVLVSERNNPRIRHLDLFYRYTSTLAGDWLRGYQDGPAAQALFDNVSGLAYDATQKIIYIADTSNQRIRKLHNGTVSTVAGDGQNGFKEGTALQAQFSYPQGVALDARGDIYVVDTGNHRIRKIDSKTGWVSTVVGSGVDGKKDGPPLQAQIKYPGRVLFDAKGNMYIADTNNHCIRKFVVAP